MFYYLFTYFNQIPGARLVTYISFRAIVAAGLAFLISMWFGKHFIASGTPVGDMYEPDGIYEVESCKPESLSVFTEQYPFFTPVPFGDPVEE